MREFLDFLEPSHYISSVDRRRYNSHQIGHHILTLPEDDFEIGDIDIFIIGCGERRGSSTHKVWSHAADTVRAALYGMYDWHSEIRVADLGNIAEGATPQDTQAALGAVLTEIQLHNKVAVVIGGSQDLTVAQYEPFKRLERMVNMAAVDMLMDLEEKEQMDDTSYLFKLFTAPVSYIRHFDILGFQSYYVNPLLLQTLDRLRFDCYRLGQVRYNITDMEPVLRHTDILTVDLNVLRASEAPFNRKASPNGLYADELCQLMKYAGMAVRLSSVGIYNLYEDEDINDAGAQTVAQALWYFVDGYRVRLLEHSLEAAGEYEEFHTTVDDMMITFKKSKRTLRWWMQLPEGTFIPCSYSDYKAAAANEFPDRWFRAQERLT